MKTFVVTLIVSSVEDTVIPATKVTRMEVPQKNFGEMVRQMVGHASKVEILEAVPQKKVS